MPQVSMTRAEVLAVADVLGYLLHRTDEKESTRAVRSFHGKVLGVLEEWNCKHCDDRYARRSDGICDACHSYRSIHDGQLPSEEVLRRRSPVQPFKSVVGT